MTEVKVLLFESITASILKPAKIFVDVRVIWLLLNQYILRKMIKLAFGWIIKEKYKHNWTDISETIKTYIWEDENLYMRHGKKFFEKYYSF